MPANSWQREQMGGEAAGAGWQALPQAEELAPCRKVRRAGKRYFKRDGEEFLRNRQAF